MDVLIVDDEPLARQRLLMMVTGLGYEVIAEASNSAEASDLIHHYDPSIVLLDIEMPGDSGLVLAHELSQLDHPPAVIIISAYDQYAIEAFQTIAAGYLLKPIQKEQLQHALEQAQTLTRLQINTINHSGDSDKDTVAQDYRQYITSKSYRGIERVAIADVRVFAADQKYVRLVSIQGEIIIDETLKDLEQEFNGLFIRVHRNALVSLEHIQRLQRDSQGHYYLILNGVDEQPVVSRRYVTKVKTLLTDPGS